jgi:hypothetical protein
VRGRDAEEGEECGIPVTAALAPWSKGVYLLAGDLWLCLTIDERTRSSASPEYTRIAFTVPGARFGEAVARCKENRQGSRSTRVAAKAQHNRGIDSGARRRR